MRFAFTDDQRAFGASVRDMLARACPPRVARASWASEQGHEPQVWARLGELGLFAAMAPEEHGGLGLSELDLVLPLEACGEALVPGPVMETALVAAPLLAAAGGAAAARWVPEIAGGRAVVATGLDRGPFVAFAGAADLLLLRGEERAIHALAPGAVELVPEPSVDGARRLFRTRFEPSLESALLTDAAGEAAAELAFDRGALGTAAMLLGLTRRMIDLAVGYASIRRQFGQPIGAFQAVKHQLADALLALELARPVVYRAAYACAHAEPRRRERVSMAKAMASDAGLLAARVALQVHGAIGYSFDYDLHLWMKRTWSLAASWGDAAFHRARVGLALLGPVTGAPSRPTPDPSFLDHDLELERGA